MSTVTRTVLATAERARSYCASIPPDTIIFAGLLGPHLRVCWTAGGIARSVGPLDPEARRIKVTVNLDALSPLARQIAETSPAALNCDRRNDFKFETGITYRECQQLSRAAAAAREAMWGQKLDEPFCLTLRYPRIFDTETGEAYYERCARLIELQRAAIREGLGWQDAVRLAYKAENWVSRPWEPDEAAHHYAQKKASRAKEIAAWSRQ